MVKSGPKLPEAKAAKVRKALRALIKENKDLQAAVDARKKASKGADNKAKLRSAIAKVVVRNPLLQQAAKDIFNRLK